MSRFEIAHIENHPARGVDFRYLANIIGKEKASMLKATPKSLEQSYKGGMSTVVMDMETNMPVGHIRFSPLTTPDLRKKLNLVQSLPNLWEIGTGIIDGSDGYRGKGLYRMVRNEHIARFQDKLNDGSLIALGTTKSLRILKTLLHAQEKYNVQGVILRHTDLPFIAAFTCVCKGDFGQGYQCGVDACGERIKPEQLPVTIHPNSFSRGSIDQTDTKSISAIGKMNGNSDVIPCTMYVQGKKDAILNMENCLRNQFGTPENLVDMLRQVNVNYYNEPLVSLLLTNLRQFMKKGVSGLNSFNLQGR